MKRILKILLVVIAFPFTKCDHKVNENHDLNQEEKGTVFEQQTTPRVVQANPDSVLTLFKGKIRPASKPQVFQQKGIIKIESGTPGIIKVNQDDIEVRTPGTDGMQLPKNVPSVEQKKLFPQPEPIPAIPISKVENTLYNLVFLDVEQGINTSNITSMLEDKRGNVWFASEGAGVSKYDGNSFLHYSTAKGLSHLLVSCIFEDSKGTIWFGTNGRGVCKYDGKTFTQITEKEGLINNQVWSIIEDKNRNLWFATRGGVCKYDGKSFMHYTEKEGLGSTWIYSIKEDKNGKLWLGTYNGIIIKYDGNSFTNYSGIEGIENHAIYSIAEDNNGNLWFSTYGGGIFKFDGASFSQYTEKEGLSSNNVWDLLVDKNGDLWIGTKDAGACKFDGRHFTHFTKNQGLSNNLVRSIMEDSSGKLWFGTYDGATIYNPKSFVNYAVNDGLIDDSITSIIEDKNGNMWFGSNGGGVCKYDGNLFTYYTKNDGLSSNNIQSILEDKDGNLWFGTNDSGVNKFNGKTFVHYTEKDGLSSNWINSLLQDKNGVIWLGTYGNGVSKYDGKTFIHYTENGGLSNNYVWSVFEDDSSNIWFCTRYDGVNKYDGKTFTHYAKKDSLTNNSIYSMLQNKTGNIWFGTMDIGIVKYDGKVFTHYSEEDGLASNTVFSIVEDKRGNLWLGTDKGLSYFEFIPDTENEDKQRINITNFDKEDGIDDLDFMINSACLDSKNRIWWGTAKGVTMQDLNEFILSKEPPIIQINTIDIEQLFIDYSKLSDVLESGENWFASGKRRINLKKIVFSGVAAFYNYPLNLKLPYNINNLTFHFSAIDWAAHHRIQYQYFVEGLDKEWRQLTKENSANYRNIPFGSYTFKVKATGIANTWSETLEYRFTIRPPWYRSNLVYGSYGVMFILALIGFIRWRTWSLERDKRILESQVKERTKEIKQQNDELTSQRDEIEAQRDLVTKQKDQILEQKQATTESIQYASRIQTAILPPDEVLKYLLPKHFILYKPQDIVSGDFYWLTQKKEKIIIVVADCTGHGVPGAFMSMLGNALLNDIVNSIKTLQANLILNKLRDQVMVSLRQSGKMDETKDGMDIALCILDMENMSLQYAGGYIDLYLIRNGKLTEIKADNMPIGISSEAGKSFTNHDLTLQQDDAIYMFSDGYVDQFGGAKGKKFMYSRFKQLLMDIQDKIMFDQKEILEHTLNEWMGATGQYEEKYEQIDDIIVMGIKV